MTKTEQQKLAEVLQSQVATSNQMWEEGRSHAFIVGYLQGVIIQTIEELGLPSK
jgi:hypothetical protein